MSQKILLQMRFMVRILIRTVLTILVLNSATAQASDSLLTYKDQAYGPHQRQQLDVYAPSQAQAAPVIFMVHGGGWRRGDKAIASVIENKIERWVSQGIMIISTNYRLLPDADPLRQAEDIATALAYAQKHAARWGASASRFVLMGHSAGAHLVSLLSADPTIAFNKGAQPWLGTVAIDTAGFDIVAIMQRKRVLRLYEQAFGEDPDYWKQVSPIFRLQTGSMPLLAICSTKRRDDPCTQAQAYADKARGFGVRVAVLPIELNHRQINLQLGRHREYTAKVEQFLNSLGILPGARPAIDTDEKH